MVFPSGLIDGNCTPSIVWDVTACGWPPAGAIRQMLKAPERSDAK